MPIAQMLADRALVEGAGRPGQLDLAVQLLVGDAEQGAVGHPQPVTLRGQRSALYVDGDGPRQVDVPPLLRSPQLPIAVVVGHHGTGSQPLFQRVAPLSGYPRRRFLQRNLHLCQRGHRHLRRH
jgi:hypothetical protein